MNDDTSLVYADWVREQINDNDFNPIPGLNTSVDDNNFSVCFAISEDGRPNERSGPTIEYVNREGLFVLVPLSTHDARVQRRYGFKTEGNRIEPTG